MIGFGTANTGAVDDDRVPSGGRTEDAEVDSAIPVEELVLVIVGRDRRVAMPEEADWLATMDRVVR